MLDMITSLGGGKKRTLEDISFRQVLAKLIETDSLETMMVSPGMAKIMMERNTGNRTLSATRVARYAKDMRDGNWKLTGEPIIFSDTGVLNDGQTRLSACIDAGAPFQSDVRFGIARDAFTVTGTGAKRTLADVFSIEGEKNSTRLAGALNWLHLYLNGFGERKLGHVDGQGLLAEHPDLRKSIDPALEFYNATKLMEPSLAVFLHYVFALKDADKANIFFEFLKDGVGATRKHDARNAIRQRLIMNKGDKAKLPPIDIAALTIKAWNAYRVGKDVQSLRWTTNPATGAPEAFPSVK